MAVKIYTKTGDKGETSLYGGQRVSKADLRVEAYGTIDEFNAALGVVLAKIQSSKKYALVKETLEKIPHDLYDIGALLATPKNIQVERGKVMHEKLPSYLENRTKEIEKNIDILTQKIAPLQAFILPGGGEVGSLLHQSRTVCRRAERRIIALYKKEAVPQEVIQYMNRLSDLLFTVARFVNHIDKQEEVLWNKHGTL